MIEKCVKRIVIIGASGHGKVVANIAHLNGYDDILFLDDDTSKKQCGNYRVVGTTKNIQKYMCYCDFIVAIGNNKIRERISKLLTEKNIIQAILIHPSAIIDESVSIDEGSVVMANTVINADVQIGKGCVINTSSSVDHDCIINDYVHISPGTHVAGNVQIGKRVWLGIGSNIINNVTVSDNCIIGAGAIVIRSLIDEGTYVGMPARKV